MWADLGEWFDGAAGTDRLEVIRTMTIRSVERLRDDQAKLLAALARCRPEVVSMSPHRQVDPAVASVLWGRVEQVVPSDPTQGSHVVVQPQWYAGMPPTCQDAPMATVVCYPAPNRDVSDYVVGETVKLAASHGVLVADPCA